MLLLNQIMFSKNIILILRILLGWFKESLKIAPARIYSYKHVWILKSSLTARFHKCSRSSHHHLQIIHCLFLIARIIIIGLPLENVRFDGMRGKHHLNLNTSFCYYYNAAAVNTGTKLSWWPYLKKIRT